MLHGVPDGPSPVGEKDERAMGVKGEPVSPELALVREDEGQSPAKPPGLVLVIPAGLPRGATPAHGNGHKQKTAYGLLGISSFTLSLTILWVA